MTQIPKTDSLRHFQEHAAEFLKQLKTTGEPLALTVDGEAVAVIQDAAAYSRLQDLLERAEAIAGIQDGLDSMRRGDGRPADEVLDEIRARHGLVA